MRPRLLILSSRFPYPLDRGDKLRMYHQIMALKDHYEICLFALFATEESEGYIDHESFSMIEDMVDHLEVFVIPKRQQLFNLFRALKSEIPFSVSLYYSNRAKKQISYIIDKFRPDHIYCQLTRMAEYVKDISTIPMTIDYMDAFGVGMQRRAEITSFMMRKLYHIEAKRMSVYERKIYSNFQKHIIISQQDADLIDNGKKFDIVCNGIDFGYFRPIDIDKKYDVGFVGNMGYLPNVAAAEYLVEDVLPLQSEWSILLAGARPHKRVKQLARDHVTITGWIDDIRLAYAECRVFVAPIWSGTGQQNKILEAMAMGIPVVTTSIVNNAIGAEPNKHILLAENAEEFKTQIDNLLNDIKFYNSVSNEALAFVKRYFNWKEKGNKIIEILSHGI